jgi:hypothetical protein
MKYNKKNLIWEGPNPSSISELLDNKPKRVSDCYIVCYENPKFEDCRSESGEEKGSDG